MANRSLTKDTSDFALAGAALADFFGNKRDRFIENHADHDKVIFKGSNEIPLKIGDNWYFTDTDVNISTGADIDTGAVAAGKDYYVYACNTAGTLSFKISLNSTNPTGFTAANSRKLGGFHALCADIDNAGHTLTGYNANDILPASVWDLKHRPISEPEGRVYDEGTGIWGFIYMATGTGASCASTYGASVQDARNWMDFVDDGHAVKSRLLSDTEYASMMAGTPEEARVWDRSDPATAGGHSAYFLLTLDVAPGGAGWLAAGTITGGTSGCTCTIVEKLTNLTYVCKNISIVAGFTLDEILTANGEAADQGAAHPEWIAHATGRIVSSIGCEDGPGTWYAWLSTPSARLDNSTAGLWIDLTGDKGGFYTYGTDGYGNTQLLAGGHWNEVAHCGSRCRYSRCYRWYAHQTTGARFCAAAQ